MAARKDFEELEIGDVFLLPTGERVTVQRVPEPHYHINGWLKVTVWNGERSFSWGADRATELTLECRDENFKPKDSISIMERFLDQM